MESANKDHNTVSDGIEDDKSPTSPDDAEIQYATAEEIREIMKRITVEDAELLRRLA